MGEILVVYVMFYLFFELIFYERKSEWLEKKIY